jgi:hypothetical protein
MGGNGDIPVDPEAIGDEIARTAAHLDAATHRLLTCIRAFDAAEEWGRQGALSCAHWLTWRLRLDPVTAREKVRVARALGGLPLIDDALRLAVLSYSQVRALTRVATAGNEERLLMAARHTTGAQLERLCRGLRRAVAANQDGDRIDDLRAFREETMENGMVRLTLVLHADEAAVVVKAIELARLGGGPEQAARDTNGASAEASAPSSAAGGESADSAESSGPPPLPRAPVEGRGGARGAVLPRMDALVRVAEAYLTRGDAAGTGGQRTQIVVHLEQDPLAPDETLGATLDDGTRLTAEAFRRLSCDATLVPIRQESGGPRLDLGRRTRTISPALRRALALRDRGCCYPGCSNHFFLHGHHIVHWAHGGRTSLDNLVTLCGTHHRHLHEGGFQVERDAEGRLVFRDRRGRTLPAAPVAPALDGDAFQIVARSNEHAGVEIDSWTGFPGWDGERIDYVWTVNALY